MLQVLPSQPPQQVVHLPFVRVLKVHGTDSEVSPGEGARASSLANCGPAYDCSLRRGFSSHRCCVSRVQNPAEGPARAS